MMINALPRVGQRIFLARGREICYYIIRLSKNSCKGEHCSPTPVCL